QEATESDEGHDEATKSDREIEDEETREQEEESFDPIPRTPKDNEDDDNNEEDQGLRIGEEERMQEEEEADELYRDSDAQQESSSTSSFMTNLLNPLIDPSMESIFTTSLTTVTPIPSPQSTMTPSIISTFTTASQLPTPPTQIPSLDLQSLPTFASVFRFEDRVKFFEENFSNIPADLSKMELKNILIDKMEGNNEDERMMIRKDPPLDQTGGLKDEEKERSMHQLAVYLNQLPGVPADLLQGLNLDSCLPVSLLLQRNLCRLPVRWRNPHIRCLKHVRKINPLFKLLSILNSFPSQGDHQHRIVIGTNLCQLLKEMLNHR
nr:hypothetical protein [Tanacetum cinerariifolium]